MVDCESNSASGCQQDEDDQQCSLDPVNLPFNMTDFSLYLSLVLDNLSIIPRVNNQAYSHVSVFQDGLPEKDIVKVNMLLRFSSNSDKS